VTEAAERFFAARIEQSWAPGYLAGRGFRREAWRRWRVGYAPGTWTALTEHLRGLGFPDAAIRTAGLAKLSRRGALIDTFRDRVMFPVRTRDGTMAGFIGRAPPGSAPVYLNGPATPLYRKRELLFGLYEAREALAAGARPTLTEGPLDAIAVSIADPGRYAGVAPCGTALTATQVALLTQAAPSVGAAGVTVAFDGDQAGRQAAVRAYHLLRAVTDDPGVVTFPAGQDPAGYLCERGTAGLAWLLGSHTRPLADLVVDTRIAKFERWLEFTEGAFAALRAVAPIVAGLPPDQVARRVAYVAAALGLSHAEVTEAVTAALPAVLEQRACDV
jgi:DNA primase catalytic core